MSNTSSLRDAIEGFLGKIGKELQPSLEMIRSCWREAVGPMIAKATMVTGFANGILYVRCKSSTWSQELDVRRKELLSRLNAQLGKSLISDIRFRAGTVRSPEEERPRNPTIPPPFELARINLTKAEEERVEEMVANIDDPELRQTVKRIITNEFKVKHWREKKGFKRCCKCGVMHDAPRDLCAVCWAHSLPLRY